MLFTGGASRSFLLRLAKFGNPDTAIDIVEKDIITMLARTPGKWKVGTEPLGIPCPKTRYLASLSIEITAQLTGHIEHSPASAIKAHHQNVIFYPDIVRPAFGNFI